MFRSILSGLPGILREKTVIGERLGMGGRRHRDVDYREIAEPADKSGGAEKKEYLENLHYSVLFESGYFPLKVWTLRHAFADIKRSILNSGRTWHIARMTSKISQSERIRAINAKLDRPVVLIGMMGAGKSRMGAMLARALDRPFMDSDREIEAAAGMSIADIFELHGEQAFRDTELRVFRRLLGDRRAVIASGGGAPVQKETGAMIFSQALTLWLNADLDILLERTAKSDRRPLLRVDPEKTLRDLMARREGIYAQAALHIPTENTGPRRTLNKILETLHDHFYPAD